MPYPPVEKRVLQIPPKDRTSLPGARARWPGRTEELKRMGGAAGRTRSLRPDPRDIEAAWRDLHLAMLEHAAVAPRDHASPPPSALEDELHRIVLDLLNETTRIARLLKDG